MKKIILAAFVSMIMLPSAYAGEEIQLAAVMSASDSSNLTANKKLYSRPGGSARYGFRDSDFEYAIIAGIVVVVVLASTADGWNSTSNH